MHHLTLSAMDVMERSKKRIVFLQTQNPIIFNLAFDDLKPDSDKPNDTIITNDGDRNKVLATVAEVINIYTKNIQRDGYS
jgi:hypothetical protein